MFIIQLNVLNGTEQIGIYFLHFSFGGFPIWKCPFSVGVYQFLFNGKVASA